MDQMLPLPSQELPSPKGVEAKPSSANEEYHVPMPEIGNHHDSQEELIKQLRPFLRLLTM